jgi:hypothetical protein
MTADRTAELVAGAPTSKQVLLHLRCATVVYWNSATMQLAVASPQTSFCIMAIALVAWPGMLLANRHFWFISKRMTK